MAGNRSVRGGLAFALVLGLVLLRGVWGAAANPPFNGPDERGHVIETLAVLDPEAAELRRVEARQPPLYYVLAAWTLRLLHIWSDPEHLDWTVLWPLRLGSVLLGGVTVVATYATARMAFSGAAALAVAAAAVAGLVPIQQFVMASAANDPLVGALAATTIAAATWVVTSGWSRSRGLVLVGSAGVAAASKMTGWGAVIIAVLVIVAGLWQRPRLRPLLLLAGGGAVVVALTALIAVLRLAPQSFFVTLILPFLGPAAWHYPQNYLLSPAGFPETFRTFWVQPDYAVPVLPALGWVVALLVAAAVAGGLWLALRRRSDVIRPTVAVLLLLIVAVQVVLVGYRYSLGVEKDVALAGAAQAKFVLPALPALATLLVAGWAGLLSATRRRWLPAGILGGMLALDLATLGPFLWTHYQWLQLGIR